MSKTLGLVEALSQTESNPERLATLTDSTLRLFTNSNYMKDAQKASGIKFFATDGSRRDPLAILAEFKTKFDTLKTDAEKQNFLSKAFGHADQDTIKGVNSLLNGETLTNATTFAKTIGDAGGTIKKDMHAAMSNAVNQGHRLQTVMQKTADDFAQPINDAFARLTKLALDKKSDGGLELSGGEIAGIAAAATGAMYLSGKLLKGVAGKVVGNATSLVGGIAEGKALEKAGMATPVFVVGAAPGLFAGSGGGGSDPAGDVLGGLGKTAGKSGLLARLLSSLSLPVLGEGGAIATAGGGTVAAGVGASATAGVAVGMVHNHFAAGTVYGDAIGARIAMVLAAFGNKEAKEARERMEITLRMENLHGVASDVSVSGNARAIDLKTVRAPLGRMMPPGGAP